MELEKAKQDKELELRGRAYDLIKSGTPEQVDEFITKTPGAQKIFGEAIKFKSERTKRNYLDTAKKIILENAEPATVLAERAKTVMSEGGDATETIQVAQQAVESPERGQEWAMKVLQIYEPQTYKNLVGVAAGMPKHQKTGAFLLRNKETGEMVIGAGDYNPATGTMDTTTASLEGFEVVSKLGETSKEQTKRRLEEKRKGRRVTKEEERKAGLIVSGVEAAESTATLRRGIELLDYVKTGGFAAAAQKAKAIFGIESADEGELSNSLSKAVLSQLRSTFGAAFTAQEGKQLTNIEAKFGKSPQANKRLLQQALKIAERKAKRARATALQIGDQTTVDDIDDLLTFSLSMEAPKAKEAKQATEGGAPAQTGPTLQEFLQKAKAVNPGVSDQELTDYYNKKYGGI